MIKKKAYGYMAALHGNTMAMVHLANGVDELKLVDPHSQTVELAKSLGVSFGE